MTRLTLAAAAALVAVFLCAQAVAHDIPCSPREMVVQQLQKKYREAVIMRGIVSGSMMELWYSPKKQTWTVVVTRPDSTACLILGGDNAMLINPAESSEPDDGA